MSVPPTSDPLPTPSTPQRQRLTRDQRRDILLMRGLGYTYARISEHLHITQGAIQYTCQTKEVTPQHRNSGRPAKLSPAQTDALETFVRGSAEARRMSCARLASTLYPDGDVSGAAIATALRKRGLDHRARRRLTFGDRVAAKAKRRTGREVVAAAASEDGGARPDAADEEETVGPSEPSRESKDRDAVESVDRGSEVIPPAAIDPA